MRREGRLVAPCPQCQGALGRPPTSTARYGNESFVVRIHSGNGEHTDMDNSAIRCFDGAH
jgi:hemoglobin